MTTIEDLRRQRHSCPHCDPAPELIIEPTTWRTWATTIATLLLVAAIATAGTVAT